VPCFAIVKGCFNGMAGDFEHSEGNAGEQPSTRTAESSAKLSYLGVLFDCPKCQYSIPLLFPIGLGLLESQCGSCGQRFVFTVGGIVDAP
jgi:hypothetical protein